MGGRVFRNYYKGHVDQGGRWKQGKERLAGVGEKCIQL